MLCSLILVESSSLSLANVMFRVPERLSDENIDRL